MPRAEGRAGLIKQLNAAAPGAIRTLISISNGEVEDIGSINGRVSAAKAILNKIIPDIKAVELAVEDVEISHKVTFK